MITGRPIINRLCFVLCLTAFIVISIDNAPPIKAQINKLFSLILLPALEAATHLSYNVSENARAEATKSHIHNRTKGFKSSVHILMTSLSKRNPR